LLERIVDEEGEDPMVVEDAVMGSEASAPSRPAGGLALRSPAGRHRLNASMVRPLW
jgi:hypothetical protein